MSQSANFYVHKGPWINWSHGRVLGSTVTLSERDGGLLTAFLATFVTAAGVACWTILSYTIHQRRASKDRQDVLHHQQQVTLRNAGTPGAAAWQFCQLIWHWRKHTVKPGARTMPILLLALLNIVFFALASIFSSEVTRAAGNQVLIRSPHCGMLSPTNLNFSSQATSQASDRLEVNDTLSANTYAQACYSKTPDPLVCDQYAQHSLSWKVNQNASCPFAPDLCWYGATAAYEMDSGRLDSHTALGINAPRSDRVEYRKVTTCSPIHSIGHTVIFNETNTELVRYGDTLVNYMFGEVSGIQPYTFQYNLHALVENYGYVLSSIVSWATDPRNVWQPIPALNRTDGDISLFFLAPNSVTYQEPVTDPMYSATIPRYTVVDGLNRTYYAPSYDVSVLGCMDQHQFCNPSNNKCTSLTGSSQLGNNGNELDQLDLSTVQYATAQHINAFIYRLTTYSSVHSRGANALRASDTVDQNSQIGLPNTQWMTEVSSWYGVSMAKLQQMIVHYATGPPYIPDGYNVTKLPTKAGEKMCKNHIIRSTSGTTSFSVLGVAIILIIGTILIATSLLLDTLMQFIRSIIGRNKHKSLQWIVDEKLQLQRLAYEEAGQGRWVGGTSSVPLIIGKDEKIGLPRNVDMAHPRLSQQATSKDMDSTLHQGTPEAERLMDQKDPNYRVDITPYR